MPPSTSCLAAEEPMILTKPIRVGKSAAGAKKGTAKPVGKAATAKDAKNDQQAQKIKSKLKVLKKASQYVFFAVHIWFFQKH